jgi:hypothetical protein
MSSKSKMAFLLILVFGLQTNSDGQTITFNNLRKMISSRDYKDSLLSAFKFIKGVHIRAIPLTQMVESESYRSPDSSRYIDLIYKDSAIGCFFFTNDLDLLQKIISDGQKDGFARMSRFAPNPKAAAYTKGEYLLLFTKSDKDNRKSNVGLVKNWEVFNISPKPK